MTVAAAAPVTNLAPWVEQDGDKSRMQQIVATVLQAIVHSDTTKPITTEDVTCWAEASATLFDPDITERKQPTPNIALTEQHLEWWQALCQSKDTVRLADLTGDTTRQFMSDIYWAVQDHAWHRYYRKSEILIN